MGQITDEMMDAELAAVRRLRARQRAVEAPRQLGVRRPSVWRTLSADRTPDGRRHEMREHILTGRTYEITTSDRAPASRTRARTAPSRAAARPRGAGRPRASATRSSARSGDSGDDGPGSSDDPDPAGRPARARIAAEIAWDGRVGTTVDLSRYLIEAGWTWVEARVAIGDAIIYGLLHPDHRGRLRAVGR